MNFANVMWVNERQDQIIIQDELQALFYKYNRHAFPSFFFA